MAMGYVPKNFSKNGSEIEVEINGNFYKSYVQSEPLYDPKGLKMRS